MVLLLLFLGLARADCTVQNHAAEVDRGAEAWTRTDKWTLSVETGLPSCRRFYVRSDWDMAIVKIKATVHHRDDTRTKIGRDRLLTPPRGETGQSHILEMPEIRSGDKLEVEVVRQGVEYSLLERPADWWSDPGDGHGANALTPSSTPNPLRIELGFEGGEDRIFGQGVPAAGVHQMRGPQTIEINAPGMRLVGQGPGLEATPQGLRFELTTGQAVASWRVVSDGKRAVLASRSAVLHQIASGALSASLPEPGIGLRFKDGAETWDVVDEVLAHMRRQVVQGRLSQSHPLKPRKLREVRRSRWGTPWEQALLLARYLGQLKIEALPVPIRPAALGRIEAAVPEGYLMAAVRVRIDGQERWVDPACAVCVVGELRPGLWGGQVLAEELDTMPTMPQPQAWEVSSTPSQDYVSTTLEFSAPWSTSLRRYLAQVPVPERRDAILQWLGVTGTLVKHAGIDALGQSVHLHVRTPLSGAADLQAALEARQASP